MKNNTIDLPIFPISIFLLPGGVTRLRIFEPRYLKLVSMATSGNGFVIYAKDQDPQQLKSWGSWVDIINFDKGEDGVLEIDVKCKSLVEISDVNLRDHDLDFAEVRAFTHWSQKRVFTHRSQKSADTNLSTLNTSLSLLITNNALLNKLYESKTDDNPYWIIARWIELLPIPLQVKNNFIFESSYSDAKKLVNSIILNSL